MSQYATLPGPESKDFFQKSGDGFIKDGLGCELDDVESAFATLGMTSMARDMTDIGSMLSAARKILECIFVKNDLSSAEEIGATT